MAKGAGGPTTEQLLELLKRAAEELKHAQGQASTAVAALQKEQAAHQQTEHELEIAQKKLKDNKGAKAANEQAQGRINELEEALATAESNVESLKASVDAERKRAQDAEHGLETAIAEREELRGTVGELETAAVAAKAAEDRRVDELQQQHEAALDAETEKQTALEADTKQQIDEAAANNAAMLDDAAGKVVAAETALEQEREKHQGTAQKLLETRSKVRELEATLAAEHEKVRGLEAAAARASEQHQAAVQATTDTHRAMMHELQNQLAQVQAQLSATTANWQQVERAYEALHREMLMVLEQRDETRRLLDSEKAERERLSRAMQRS